MFKHEDLQKSQIKQLNSYFRTVDVVDRGSETQRQVGENWIKLTKLSR